MSTNMRASDFFVAGGTLRPDAPSYVKRPADDELFHLASAGKFCYVLTPRQMGKSSLMIRTAHRLQQDGVRTAIIDLTKIGTDVSVEQWYLGLVTRLKVQLRLSVDLDAWWAERASLSAVQRFTDFLHDVVLAEIDGSVVIFIDEIDTTLNLNFSDDFFAAIRFTYNARASDPAYHRLTFVLLGVTTPADLIKDRSRTPFNIGQGVDLHEFSREDAQVLRQGLQAAYPEQGEPIFDRIFYWTDGHPYLTQKLCLTVVERGDGSWTNERIDELVESLFLSEEARKETNLQFVRDSVNASPQRRRLLSLYRKVHEGKEIPEDERSLDQNRLKLFGLVRAERGVLQVRNEIYRRAFNLDWIKASTPADWTRRIAVVSTFLVLLLTVGFAWLIPRQRQQTIEARAQAFVDSFQSTTSAEVRINSLAGLFDLPGYEDQARQLFRELGPEDQLALFDLGNPQEVGAQLTTVVQGLYADLKDDVQGNALLRAMAQALRKLEDPVAINLATEIEQWLEGRGHYAQRGYQQAIAAYEVAIRLNDHNPGTRFDRGRAFVGLKDYPAALDDFEEVIRLDQEWLSKVEEVIEGDSKLFEYLGTHRDANPDLATHFPTLTPTPTSTNTPTPTPTLTPSPTNTSTPTPTPTNTPTPTFTPRPPTPTFTPVPPTPVPTQPPRAEKTKPAPTQPPPTQPPPTEPPATPRPPTPTPA
jgi:tetratricopeptide (TPR) repeat protein